VRSASLQGARTAVTDANGNFIVRALPPGAYDITFEMAGLASRTEKVSVEVSRQATIAELAPGLTNNTPNNGQVTISGGFGGHPFLGNAQLMKGCRTLR